jgi:16S rRNA (guanine966-N2)-methyltransferase
VKETLFAILEPALENARFLDLFAGSGAAGIEALSRGAASATFVERDRSAVRAIRSNLSRTDLGGRARVVEADALVWLGTPAGSVRGPFDIVFVDPPYARPELLVEALARLEPHLASGARVVAKRLWRTEAPTTVGLLASERERRFGETALTFYRREEGG